jgi:hypothetical protein
MKGKNQNEGEGNKSADREYREGVKKHLSTHDVEREGKDAQKALDDPHEGAKLREAEKTARKRAAGKDV